MTWISAMRNRDDLLVDLKSLRCFVVAAERGSFSSAASALGVAQSALSRQITQLESTTGCRLFHRTGRGVTLTEIGQTMLPRAQIMLRTARQLVDDAVNQHSQPAGSVTIAVLPGLSRSLVSLLLNRLLSDYPLIRLKAIEAYSGDVENMLAEGRADIGVFNRYRPLEHIDKQAVLTAPLFLVGKSGSSVLQRQTVNFSDIPSLPLVLPTRPNAMRTYLDEICNRLGLVQNVILEASSGTLIHSVLHSCNVFSLLPYHAIAEEVQAGILAVAHIEGFGIQQATFIETTRKYPFSNASRAVYQLVIELMKTVNANSHRLRDEA